MSGSITCPRCGTWTALPMDVRLGWCWTCLDFTGEPREFMFMPLPDEPPTEAWTAFATRISVRNRLGMPSQPQPLVSADVWDSNLAAFRASERYGYTIADPSRLTVAGEASAPRVRLWPWLLLLAVGITAIVIAAGVSTTR